MKEWWDGGHGQQRDNSLSPLNLCCLRNLQSKAVDMVCEFLIESWDIFREMESQMRRWSMYSTYCLNRVDVDVSCILEAPLLEIQNRRALTCDDERSGRPISCVVDFSNISTGPHSLCQNLPLSECGQGGWSISDNRDLAQKLMCWVLCLIGSSQKKKGISRTFPLQIGASSDKCQWVWAAYLRWSVFVFVVKAAMNSKVLLTYLWVRPN